MRRQNTIIMALLLVAIIGLAWWLGQQPTTGQPPSQSATNPERSFAQYGLSTDTTQTKIDLNEVLSGGPGKDGIPALTKPDYVAATESGYPDAAPGVLVEIAGEARFYPFGILVWHEIVNDQIDGQPFAVTFCPLCGSAIVFDRRVNGETLEFGVSGLLWQSNLLMYDRSTETLWSQAGRRAVVGSMVGSELAILPLKWLTLGEVRAEHPTALVLSEDTGHRRNYRANPYSGYEDDERLIFPVSVKDERFAAKEIMLVIPLAGKSYVLPDRAVPAGTAQAYETAVGQLRVSREGSAPEVILDGEVVPSYYEMWFSWAVHHQDDGVVLAGLPESDQ